MADDVTTDALVKAAQLGIHNARFTRVSREPQPMDASDAEYCGYLARAALRAVLDRAGVAAEVLHDAASDLDEWTGMGAGHDVAAFLRALAGVQRGD